MKNIKRTLAVLLCLLMLVTTVPFAVAEEPVGEPVSDPTCEHSYGDFIPMNDATCIANGHEAATCSLCGDRVVREIPDSALGHTDLDLSDWQYPEGYDCAAGGIRFKECARCGELTIVETLEPHTPVEVIDPGVERIPCERDGKSAGIHCEVCGKVILSPVIEPAHTFEGTVVKEATCLTGGEIQRVCADCGESISEVTPPTGHKDEDENGICDVCEQPLGGQTDPTSGQCGDNVYWSYDADTATLTISGEGEMWDYDVDDMMYYDGEDQPWHDFRGEYSLVIEDGVTSIGDSAFYDCSSLTSVMIGDGVTSIGDSAFKNCNSLTSVTIGNSVTKIGFGAFEYDDKLQSVTIPENVETIEAYAFDQCESLVSIEVDKNNSSYSSDSNGALYNKDQTVFIKWPEGSLIEHAVLPESVIEISNYEGFRFAKNLKTIGIPAGVESLSNNVFSNTSALESIVVDPDNPYYSNEAGCLLNKEKTELICCPSGKQETSFVIPNTVKTVCSNSFSDCKNFREVIFPEGLISIGDMDEMDGQVFFGCENITWFSIPSSVIHIAYSAFDQCVALQGFDVAENNSNYCTDESGTLYNKDKTLLIQYPIGKEETTFEIPEVVAAYSDSAFSYSQNLKEIVFPRSMKAIHYLHATNLQSVSILNYHCEIDSLYCKTIRGYKGSSAEAYAEENNIAFVSLCNHADTTDDPGRSATCTEDGYTAGVYCNDCEQWIEGHEVIPAGHKDADGDFLCDNCGADLVRSIHVDETLTVDIKSGALTYLRFVPEETATYIMTSLSDSDTYGYLFDSEMNELDANDDDADSNFRLTNTLNAGETYYYGVRFYDEEASGSFDVALTKVKVCSHADITESPEQPATCTEDGYTAGVYCNDCEQWIVGHEVIPAGHRDKDGDFLCDNCGENMLYTIHVDETLTVNITGGALTYLRFVPEETATYTLTSLSDGDTYGYLFDSGMNELDANDDDTDSNFRLTNTLTAGETYYYGVRFYQEKASGSFDVSLIKESVHSGQCGDNATWKLALPSGEMRIEGEGALWSDDESNAPWANYMSEIKTVKIDDGITNIPANAFFGAYKLKRVELPSALKTIGSYAFFLCVELKSAVLPQGLETIGLCAFEGCCDLNNLSIPDGVTSIGELAFAMCASLESVVLPEGLTTIEQGLFMQCFRLESVTIPASVTAINGTDDLSPFALCFHLKTVTNLSSAAAASATTFTTLSLPEGLSESDVLNYLDVYTKITILYRTLKVLTEEEAEAYQTKELEAVFGDDYENIVNTILDTFNNSDEDGFAVGYPADLVFHCFSDSAEYAYCSENNVPYKLLDRGQCGDDVYFSFDRSSGKLTISGTGAMWDSNPNYGYVHVWQDAFQDSYKNEIQTIVIEDGVTSIGAISFSGCSSLTSVTISDSVTMIDDIAFYECDALTDVYYLGTEAQWNQIDIHNDFEGNAALLNASIHFIVTDDDTDVSLTYDADVFDADVEIDITEIPTGDDHSRAWNITPTLNGEKVQPNAPVLVKLPIPTGWDKTKIVLTHTKADGTVEYPEFTIEGDYVVFWATEFSEYALELQVPHIHTYDDGVVTKAATCKEEGVKTFTCVDGDDSYTVPIPVNPNNHADYGTHVVNASDASCNRAGYTGDTVCNGCGKTVAKGSAIPMTDHSDSNNDGHCDACGRQMEGGDHCPQCGKVHNEFLIGWLISIIHRIVYRLTHLFG